MNQFFKRLGLIVDLSTTLDGQKAEFTTYLRDYVEDKSTSVFMGDMEALRPNKYHLKGKIGENAFKIRYKKELGFKSNMALASGELCQKDDQIQVDVRVDSVSSIFYLLLLLLLFCFGGGGAMLVLSVIDELIPLGIAVVVLGQLHLLLGIIWYTLRKSTQRLVRTMEVVFNAFEERNK